MDYRLAVAHGLTRRRPVRVTPLVGIALAVAGLVCVASAAAHPALTPATLNAGTKARIAVEIPNERPGHATTGLTLTFPAGFTVDAAEDTDAWRGSTDGRTASWTGDRITGESSVTFTVELTAVAPTGTYDVGLDQRYDDDRSVLTKAQIVVLPALEGDATPDQHVGRAIVVAVVGVVVVVGSLLALHALRRRRPAA